jgi:Zn-dependent M28 family amino/carboxypeptidase
MISRNAKGELWVAGTHHYPFLRPFVEQLAARARVTLQIGHDLPGTGSNDWTTASDHGPFHAEGIPFLYFGVEDHEDYHRASDDPAKVDADFYGRAVETIHAAVRTLDQELGTRVPQRGARPGL